jgi:hypothetical protein
VIPFRKKKFAGTDACEDIFKECCITLFNREFASGQFDGGYGSAGASASASDPSCSNSVGSGVIKQRFINEGAW